MGFLSHKCVPSICFLLRSHTQGVEEGGKRFFWTLSPFLEQPGMHPIAQLIQLLAKAYHTSKVLSGLLPSVPLPLNVQCEGV